MFRIKGIVVIRDNQPYKLPDITATSYGDAMHQLEKGIMKAAMKKKQAKVVMSERQRLSLKHKG
jgi:hypothetical protein